MIHVLLGFALLSSVASAGPGPADRTPTPSIRADYIQLDTIELNKQLMKENVTEKEMAIAVWMPREYFLAYEVGGGASQRVIDGLTRDLEAVSVFLVASCEINDVVEGGEPLQELAWRAGDEMIDGIELRAPDGSKRRLLESAAVPRPLLAYLQNSLPYLTAGFGELGKHMSFVFFENELQEPDRAINPLGKSSISMVLNGLELKWRLPIGGFLTPRVCGECREQFPGDYNYLPI